MSRWWCANMYNGDTRPETMARIKEDLESLNAVGLAYLFREARGSDKDVVALKDDYDAWRQ